VHHCITPTVRFRSSTFRSWPGWTRPSTATAQRWFSVDARNKSGHDGQGSLGQRSFGRLFIFRKALGRLFRWPDEGGGGRFAKQRMVLDGKAAELPEAIARRNICHRRRVGRRLAQCPPPDSCGAPRDSALAPSPNAHGSTPARSGSKPRSRCIFPGYKAAAPDFPRPPYESGASQSRAALAPKCSSEHRRMLGNRP
jgi:hypothetical protein